MSNNVVAFPSNPQAMGAIRDAVNERAKSVGANEEQRRHAIAEAFKAARMGASPARAIAAGNADLRPRCSPVFDGRPYDGDAA